MKETNNLIPANQILKNRNLKATNTRIRLIEIIQDYETAIPFSEIQKSLENTDRITLYRTIQTLMDKGVIHKAFTNQKNIYYALCGHHCSEESHIHNHVHFRCTNCALVSCEYLENEVEISIPKHRIEKININITGICERCILKT